MNRCLQRERTFGRGGYKEREHLEEEGIGDQLSELQQFRWNFDGAKLKSLPWTMNVNQRMYGAKGRWWS